jgi:hypothetical protein
MIFFPIHFSNDFVGGTSRASEKDRELRDGKSEKPDRSRPRDGESVKEAELTEPSQKIKVQSGSSLDLVQEIKKDLPASNDTLGGGPVKSEAELPPKSVERQASAAAAKRESSPSHKKRLPILAPPAVSLQPSAAHGGEDRTDASDNSDGPSKEPAGGN